MTNMIDDLIRYYKTINVPEIDFNTKEGKFCISGKSVFENVEAYYKPLITKLDKYIADPLDETVFVFKMEYFNTSSALWILKIFYRLEELHKNGKDVCVKWYYAADDEDMEEAGADYGEMVEYPVKLIPTDEF